MSDTDSNQTEEESSENRDPDLEMPEGIAPPPMPKPDLHDIIKEGPTYGEQDSSSKKGKAGKKKSSHPLDTVATPDKLPTNKSGGNACCVCVLVGLLLIALLAVTLVWAFFNIGPGRPLKEDHEVVNHTDKETVTITEAPDAATYYVGNRIVYEAPVTKAPVSFFGKTVHLNGDYYENVMVTGAKVTCTGSARFAKDLEIWAVEFIDEGITLKGELKGRVIQNK
jgi:hypothetical protein